MSRQSEKRQERAANRRMVRQERRKISRSLKTLAEEMNSDDEISIPTNLKSPSSKEHVQVDN